MYGFGKMGAALTLVAGICACGGSTASEEPDVVIAPAALARALADDPRAAVATYGGQVLELSGTVGEKVQPGGLNPTLGVSFASIDDRLAFDANLSFVSFDSGDGAAVSEFESLAVGDAVTLRCHFEVLNEAATLFAVNDCRVASDS
jgi:hypothetical protein